MKDLIQAGKVTPVIDRTYPLSEARRRCGTWKKVTPGGRSSSRYEARARCGTDGLDARDQLRITGMPMAYPALLRISSRLGPLRG